MNTSTLEEHEIPNCSSYQSFYCFPKIQTKTYDRNSSFLTEVLFVGNRKQAFKYNYIHCFNLKSK